MTENGYANVHSSFSEDICELVMDNPGRSNALSLRLLAELAKQLVLAKQKNARVVILSGAGDRFSAGGDFNDLTGTIEDLAMDDAIEKVVDAVLAMPAPVIAAVEGPCMGGAVDIALACDFLVAGDNAFFQVPAARMALLYNPRAILRWQSRLPMQTMRSMLLAGERLTADAAFHAGVVSHIAPAGAVKNKAHELAARVLGGTREAVAATKGLLVALQSGAANLERFEDLRREILASPERAKAVDRAKQVKPTGRA